MNHPPRKPLAQRLNIFHRSHPIPASKSILSGGPIILASSLLVVGLVYGLKQMGLVEPTELFTFDRLTRQIPDQPLDDRMVIVGITEEDIQQYGWPLNDDVLAMLLQQLQKHQPRVIGLDLYRSNFKPPGQEELKAQLAAQNLIAIMNVGSDPEVGEVPPPPTVEPDRIGFNDFPTDLDGVIRRNLLFVRTSERDYYSFALRVVLMSLQIDSRQSRAFEVDPTAIYLNGQPLSALYRADGGYHQVDDRGYQILLNYRSRYAPSEQLSISQVLSGQVNPEKIRHRIVLIGTTAPSLKDQFFTPFSSEQDQQFTMPGVVIHAQMVSQLLDAIAGEPALYRFLPPWSELLWLWVWCLLAGTLVWYVHRPAGLLLSSSVAGIALVGIGRFALIPLIWLPVVEPMVGFLATAGMVMAYKLLYRSTHDALTGLLNRDAFMGQVNHKLKQSRGDSTVPPAIVVFLDIDRFKVINESLGHEAGDHVLATLAYRLQRGVPPSTVLARVGGDEFALLLEGMERRQAGEFLDNLQQQLTEPLAVGNQKFSSKVSMGIAITQAGYDHKAVDLLRDAHTAMYRAKALGKSRYEVFAAGMLVEAVNRLKLESDLISALEKQEFLLYYQPIIRLETGQISGFEALVRWQQQDRGFVLPSAFIPVAEETGLIMPLGQWIFREACHQLKRWHEAFPHHQGLTMSINLSNRQFSQPDLVSQIATALQHTGVNGESIRLEITESMVMGDVESAIDLMLKLKSLDLKLGIDDFGTGYSSLSYLHRFPMDTLKVDKSFVGRMEDSPEDREIVHTIIALGHKLGMEIVAEGIELQGQVERLKGMKCEYGQGYFFSKPLSHEAATTLLTQEFPAPSPAPSLPGFDLDHPPI